MKNTLLKIIGWLYILDTVGTYGREQYYKGRSDQARIKKEYDDLIEETIIIRKKERAK